MKQLVIITALFLTATFSTHITFGQSYFELPQNIDLKTEEDYANSETTIINAARWLEETDLDKRAKVNAFVVLWMIGTKAVSVEITEPLSKIYGKNAQLLPLYFASYARNILENKSTSNKFTATKSGLISIMNIYKKGIQITKNKDMEKTIKMTDSELDSYINKNFK